MSRVIFLILREAIFATQREDILSNLSLFAPHVGQVQSFGKLSSAIPEKTISPHTVQRNIFTDCSSIHKDLHKK